MCKRFLKLNLDSQEALYLLRKHRTAFALLLFIAERARRENGHPDGLTIGQCYIGDCENMGLTRQEYRTALNILIVKKYLEKVETCRTRQKSTTGSTTVGTLVRLLDSRIWDINSEESNHRSNHRPTTDQPPTNHEQEGIRKNKKEEEIEYAQPASRPRTFDSLFFNFDIWQFEGITEKDMSEWKLIYPHVELQIEIKKAALWLRNNPSKAKKTLWRKYLTGWLGRANDTIENKKAYRVAASAGFEDRRTKNMDGTPIKSRAEELF